MYYRIFHYTHEEKSFGFHLDNLIKESIKTHIFIKTFDTLQLQLKDNLEMIFIEKMRQIM